MNRLYVLLDKHNRGLNRSAPVRWLVGKPWFWAVTVGLLFGLPLIRALVRETPIPPPVLRPLPPFTLVRESGQPFSTADLKGKVWVASRFDPSGTSAAMKGMHELERHMRKLADAFALVSMAEDGAAQPVPLLAEWARAHKLNPRRYVLVTGSDPALAAARATLGVDPPRPTSAAPLVLVDGQLRVRGVYDVAGADRHETLQQLMYDAALLVHEY